RPLANGLGFENAPGAGTACWYGQTYGSLPSSFSTSPACHAVNWSFYATLTTNGVANITIGDPNIESSPDNGNANLLVAQQASLSQAATIQSCSFYVTQASGNLILGIYDASGPNGGAGNLMAQTNGFTPRTGWNKANVTAPVTLPAGSYWLAYLPSDNGLGFEKENATGTACWRPYTYGSLPSSFPGASFVGVGNLDQGDLDTGSGGVLVVPDQPGFTAGLAVAAGKTGDMYLLNRSNLGGYNTQGNNVLAILPIGSCWCGESYFQGWDSTGRVVSSGGNNIMVWKLGVSATPTLVQERVSPQLNSGQDGGFFTTVSSNGTRNAVIWAVGRPVDTNPANVTLYAFDPQAAAHGTTSWLFSAVAGTWPNSNANANVVPVVANGRVYVA